MASRRDSPADGLLFAWGAALRRTRARHRRLQRRAFLIALGIGALGLTIVAPPAPRLLWNVSSSAPTGLYLVSPGAVPQIGDMVIARLPRGWRTMAAKRRYLPAGVPLVKRVAAAGGDEICVIGPALFINGDPAALRRRHDGRGRNLPWWGGCIRLGRSQFFLLMSNADSLDGRYFGPSAKQDIVGTARLLWAA